jgi:hypothetical protein
MRGSTFREPVMRIPLVLLLLTGGTAIGDGPPTIHVAPVVPSTFRLLTDPGVQQDVGLNAAQQAAADRVRQLLDRPVRAASLGRFGVIPADAVRASRVARIDAYLSDTLTKAQRTRLDQILFQLREREFGPHIAFAMAARDLGLRPDQVDDARAIKVQRVEEIAKVVTSGKRFEKVKADVETTNGDTFEKMAEMLTRAQRERLKELRGKPFAGKVVFEAGVTVPPPKMFELKVDQPEATERPARPVYSASQVGLYDMELAYLKTSVVQAELKLIDSQVRAIAATFDRVADGYTEEGRVRRGWVEQVHAATEKVLNEQLLKDQRDRFDQIMLQRRAKVGAEAACCHPAAVASLKLTPVQAQQLAAGKPIESVLTETERTAFAKLLGKPFDFPSIKDDYLPARHSAPAPAAAPVRVLDVPYAFAREFLVRSDRLKLSAGQLQKLRDLAEDEPKIRELIWRELSLDDTPPVVGPARSLTAVNAVAEHYAAAVEKQCWEVLDAQQQSLARKLLGRR